MDEGEEIRVTTHLANHRRRLPEGSGIDYVQSRCTLNLLDGKTATEREEQQLCVALFHHPAEQSTTTGSRQQKRTNRLQKQQQKHKKRQSNGKNNDSPTQNSN
eukprot:scaffold4495_cov162-Ochromonas_danica.AAC.1